MDNLEIFYDDNYIVKMNTYLLYKNSMAENYFNAHILMRYYAAKCYLEKNNEEEAFRLYNEMQQKRFEFKPQIGKEKADNEKAFKELIDSIVKNGFYDNSPILINKNLKLFNGSHRLAIALLLHIDYVPVKITAESEDKDYPYDLSWFESQGMYRQIEIIKEMAKIIENQ